VKKIAFTLGTVCVGAAASLLAFLGGEPPGHAADHGDAANLTTNKAADINDVFAWMNADATKLNLAMSVVPDAMAADGFGTNVQYVFHINRSAAFPPAAGSQTETLIICEFASATSAQCWIGSGASAIYISGDLSNTAGVASTDGKVKVFAGLRNDPFFFNLDGFQAAAAAVRAFFGAPAPPDYPTAPTCPTLPPGTSTAVTTLLRNDNPPDQQVDDDFAGKNIYAIVFEIDKTVFAGTGDFLGVWASTHMK